MIYLFVLAAVLTRFVPHLPNFSPVYGVLLVGGAYLKSRDAVWYPVAILAISDVLLTTQVYKMHVGWTQSIVWLGFAAVALCGRWLRGRISVATVLAASVVAPLVFFVISNFAVWLDWKLYPTTWAGLVACYVAAVPFLGHSLASSVGFTAALFSALHFYKKKRADDGFKRSLA
jgi:uncharacterized protein DUF6580